ncbi:MAG: hypothetical protein LQ340_000343 [Diploschistes diacapsis]|nr:MAG: hypothetical protein LQ340_000343 [Diploschistes diacapsis]
MADVTPQSPPLNGDESLQGVVIAFIVWSAVLPIIFVALRIIVRTRIIKIRLWWDDYFIIAAAAIISVVSDFSFALYPILIIWHVKIRLKDKVGLCLLMGLGVIRRHHQLVLAHLKTSLSFEIGLGIICACIPTLIPGYKWLKQKLSHHGSSGSGKGAKATGAALPFEPGRHKRREGDSAQLLRATPQDAKSSIVPPSSSGGGSWQEERRPVDNAEAERGIRKTTHMEVKHGEGVDRANDLRPSLNDSRDGF